MAEESLRRALWELVVYAGLGGAIIGGLLAWELSKFVARHKAQERRPILLAFDRLIARAEREGNGAEAQLLRAERATYED